jgi:hypothetical protein
VSYDLFGHRSLVLNEITGDLEVPTGFVGNRDVYQESPFCEVLGREQRKWLRKAVNESTAAVKLFVSGSVLLGDPTNHTCGESVATGAPVSCRCGGDNLDCYTVAQRELFHIMTHTTGCSVVLTGDFHWSGEPLKGIRTISFRQCEVPLSLPPPSILYSLPLPRQIVLNTI